MNFGLRMLRQCLKAKEWHTFCSHLSIQKEIIDYFLISTNVTILNLLLIDNSKKFDSSQTGIKTFQLGVSRNLQSALCLVIVHVN